MFKIIITCFIAVLAVMSVEKADAASLMQELSSKPLNRACLPQAGRMLKDDNAACHCPPQQLCPKDLDEWTQGIGLPPDIANICCSKPKECAFDRINFAACGVGNSFTSSKEEYCYKYSVTSHYTEDEPYKSALKKINKINANIAEFRDQLSDLSNSNDTSGIAFNGGMSLVAQIRAEIAKTVITPASAIATPSNGFPAKLPETLPANIAEIFALNSVENSRSGNDVLAGEKTFDKSIKVTCTPIAKTTFCTKQISDTCPVDNCAGVTQASIELAQPFSGWFDEIPSKCWCPTGKRHDNTEFYAEFYKKEFPELTIRKYYFFCQRPGDCVLQSTKITMADGSLKNIEEIRVGEFVRGYMSVNKVTAVTLNEEEARLYSINDKLIVITAGHPILTRKGWKAIDVGMVVGDKTFTDDLTKLEVGDEILMTDESVVVVNSIDIHEQKNASKYNLAVGGDHTFTANGMVIRAFKANTTY